MKVAGKKLVEMGSMSMKGTWDDRGRAGAQARCGQKRGKGHLSWTGGKDRRGRLLANAEVRVLPAERGCHHLYPRKSTTELKGAFPTLAGLPGPAASGRSDPRVVGVLLHLWTSLYQPWGTTWAPQNARRLFLQVPTPPPDAPACPSQYRPPGYRRSQRSQPARAAASQRPLLGVR